MKPKPLFVGSSCDDTNEDVVRLYAESIKADYTRGPCHGQWLIGGKQCWVTLVSMGPNGPADWRFAVFEDGPYFRV